MYGFEEDLTFNLTTDDVSVILIPPGGVMIISNEDSDISTNGSSNVLIKQQIKGLLNEVLTSYGKMEFLTL